MSTGNQTKSYINPQRYRLQPNSSDSYPFLTSSVHTPIKRYIPTPPPIEEPSIQTRYRLKCCNSTPPPPIFDNTSDNFEDKQTSIPAPTSPPQQCLHCNTVMRRTTGVHQTTQTTGPLSPLSVAVSPPPPPPPSGYGDNEFLEASSHPQQIPNTHESIQVASTISIKQQIDVITTTNISKRINLIQQSLPPQSEIIIEKQALSNRIKIQIQKDATPFSLWLKSKFLKFFGLLESFEDSNGDNEESKVIFVKGEYERLKWLDRHSRFGHRMFRLSQCQQNRSKQFPYIWFNSIITLLKTSSDQRNFLEDVEIFVEEKQNVSRIFYEFLQNIFRKVIQRNGAFNQSLYLQIMSGVQQHLITSWHLNSSATANLSQPLEINVSWLTGAQIDICGIKSRSFAPGMIRSVLSTSNFLINEESLKFFNESTEFVPDTEPNANQSISNCDLTSDFSTIGVGNFLSHRARRVQSKFLDGILDNSQRNSVKQKFTENRKLLGVYDLNTRYDFRPVFTYWLITIEVLVLATCIFCYGLAPIGTGWEQKSGQVLVTSLSLQHVQRLVKRNLWIGPAEDDLVHVGARYGICMKTDSNVIELIRRTRKRERETACCIRNDDSGCVQSSQADCSIRGLWSSKSLATWKKWSPGDSGPGGRISGSVCGLDPKYCDTPASVAPYEWPDDITKWPICRKTNMALSARYRFKDQNHVGEHMLCEVIGHPCCTGTVGECRITTREYCDFISGHYHEEANLCSQVFCLNDICGMLPFIRSELPDQIYRNFTSLCLHAGVIQLLFSVAFQWKLLLDIERLFGSFRTAILYFAPGIFGNLVAAIFLPYKTEIGPTPSLAGICATIIMQLIFIHWNEAKQPYYSLIKFTLLITMLAGIGVISDWHESFYGVISGFIFGAILTIGICPHFPGRKFNRQKKIKIVICSLLMSGIIFIMTLCLFYWIPTKFTDPMAIPQFKIHPEDISNYTVLNLGKLNFY